MHATDFKEKMDAIRWLFDHYGLKAKTDWIYVGDGKNDKYIAELAPISFGIDSHPELERVVTYNISSFDEIIPLLNDYFPIDSKTDYISKRHKIRKPITRIEKLEKDNYDLRKHNWKLQKQLDELIQAKRSESINHVKVLDSDYYNKPSKHLMN